MVRFGSAADEIVSAPSALTGSIGAVAIHTDQSPSSAKAGIEIQYMHAGKTQRGRQLQSAVGRRGASGHPTDDR
ncbi:S49 family peptidase [Limnoglobus roseus]|uniref:S49 family peptidase n=1 Tax=Limnoglobus roseus TaxID=2598579 RepID=UPI0036F3D989